MRHLRFTLAAGLLVVLSVAASAATFRIEIDYMGADTDGHDHEPSQLVLDAVVQMFACQGHTLILDLSQEVPHTDFLTGDPTIGNDCGNFWTYTGQTNTYRSYRNLYRDQGAGWHYCIFAHQYRKDADDDNTGSGCANTSSSGRASGGDSFIVSLGGFGGQTGSVFEQAATLAHEFGHNLGLGHTGSNPGVVTPYVQNLPSVMSYTYQLGGVRNTLLGLGFAPDYALFKDIDFSFGRMCSLNEASLDELRGTRMQRVDFNCDNDTNDLGVLQDLGFRGSGLGNNAPWCGEADDSRTSLADYNEWANIDDGAALVANGERGEADSVAKLVERERKLTLAPCITSEEWQEVELELGGRGAPTLEVESCITGRNVYVATSANAAPTGACTDWYPTIQQAHSAMPLRSVFYVTPGTFNETGTTVLNRRGTWTCNTGVATIQ